MALASQSVRNSTSPRSSVAYNRSRGGLLSGTRQKRLLGIGLLAVICVGVWFWVTQRDGSKGDRAGGANPAAVNTSPSTPSLVTANPIPAQSRPVVSEPPALEMAAGRQPKVSTQAPAPQPTLPAATPVPAPTTTAPSTPPIREPLNEPTAPAPSVPPQGTPTGPSGLPQGGAGSSGGGVLAAADRAIGQNKLLEARTMLNRALLDPSTSASERNSIRHKMSDVNQTLMFGPAQTAGDPFSETYKVVSGDKLNKINRKLQLITEPGLIARVNKLANPNALRVGQTLKVIRGPFHAVVTKSQFRMDVYVGPTPAPSALNSTSAPDGAEPGWTYVCSFPVGLGEKGLTPVGSFTIKENSKLIDPHWVNPRTGEKFDAKDPKNPIGERWLGLEGVDEKSKAYTGYGIHGTIDPQSVGREMSMGCVRMASADVELVYELLTGRVSVVKIRD